MVNGVKMLFLELVIVPTFMLIMEKIGEGPTDGLDDTAIEAEAKYCINITKLRKKICLNLHHNGSKCFWYANGVKINQFKAKHSEINTCSLCLVNI